MLGMRFLATSNKRKERNPAGAWLKGVRTVGTEVGPTDETTKPCVAAYTSSRPSGLTLECLVVRTPFVQNADAFLSGEGCPAETLSEQKQITVTS